MRLAVLLLLLLPLALMILGFWLVARILFRHGEELAPEFAADGSRILLYAPSVQLLRVVGARGVRGSGTLLLTERDLVFERFFPRREFRIPLNRITGWIAVPEDATENGDRRGDRSADRVLVRWDPVESAAGSGLEIRVSDPGKWEETIRRASASGPPEPGARLPARDLPRR